MKRFLPTIVLVILCLGGFWYAHSKDMFKSKDSASGAKQLLTMPTDGVQSLSLKTDKADVAISKNGDNWTMSKPAPLPLNSFSVEGWISSFSTLNYESKVQENPTDLTEFGLNQPKEQFTVQLKDGSSHTLLVGRPLPVSGTTYAKLAEGPAVYEVSDTQLQGLEKVPVDFMNNKAIDSSYDKISALKVDWKGQSWKLEKEQADKTVFESTWKIGSKELKPEEGTAVLDKLMALVTQEEAKPAASVAANASDLRIEVTEADAGKSSTAVFTGKIDGDNVWIAKDKGDWAYAVPITDVQALADAGK